MEELIEAIKSNDLVKVKRVMGPMLQERATALIEKAKVKMAKSVMIEGEEREEDESEEDDEDAKKTNAKEKEELDDKEDEEEEE